MHKAHVSLYLKMYILFLYHYVDFKKTSHFSEGYCYTDTIFKNTDWQTNNIRSNRDYYTITHLFQLFLQARSNPSNATKAKLRRDVGRYLIFQSRNLGRLCVLVPVSTPLAQLLAHASFCAIHHPTSSCQTSFGKQ